MRWWCGVPTQGRAPCKGWLSAVHPCILIHTRNKTVRVIGVRDVHNQGSRLHWTEARRQEIDKVRQE